MSGYGIPHSSPLDTLVGKTSSRRPPNAIQIPPSHAASGGDSDPRNPYVPMLGTPPRRRPPQSPLLHTRFRTSVATQSSFNTSAEPYGRTHARSSTATQSYDDDVSIYSTATASLPIHGRLSSTVPPELDPIFDLSSEAQDPDQNPNFALERERSPSRTPVTLPTVVVSVEEPDQVAIEGDQGRLDVLSSPSGGVPPSLAGRIPSALPKHLNFSRPVRPGGDSDDAKRQVLARNAFRQSAPPSRSTSPHSSGQVSSLQGAQRVPETPSNNTTSSITHPSALMPSTHPPPNPRVTTKNLVPLLHEPPRASSPTSSLYSAYSYYQLDSPSGSPTHASLQIPASSHTPPRTPSPLANPTPKGDPQQQSELADVFLQEGIQHHEANRLREAAIAFEKSATTPGGSGVGMLMWGLTLRHGWGCPKDENLGFSWLRRAAEAAVGDLERARAGLDISAVRGELVLAIYEVGQCFFQGWGVKKDQKMAVSYFQIAARLGDVDAQQELAFCYANGRGCKKDRKEAAKWYREAVAQGASDVGLAWIYKEKFQ